MKKNVYVIIDGQAGSCGKGKVIGQFALEKKVDVAIANCMPNAGHTFCHNGKKRVFRNIPVSAVNKNTQLFIGAGSAIDLDVLRQEYEDNKDLLDGREIIVHPLVPIIQARHIEKEKELLRSGSTFKGGGACLSEKVMRLLRSENKDFFKELEGTKIRAAKSIEEYHKIQLDFLKNAKKVLIEGSQGCDLDLNHSGHYPHVTSRQVSVAQMLADSGISPQRLKEVVMVIRPFPIRISNTTNIGKTIYSGDYGKSQELTWEQINVAAYLGIYPTMVTEEDIEAYSSEIAYDFTEYTTVTKRKRRVFDIDIEQLRRNIAINTPNSIYLNFFQHLSYDYMGQKGKYEELYINKYIRTYLEWLESELNVPISYLGTGADVKEHIDRKRYVKQLKKDVFYKVE